MSQFQFSIIKWFVCLVFCLEICSPLTAAPIRHGSNRLQEPVPPQTVSIEAASLLEVGKSIEAKLQGGMQHSYQVSLSEGQYLDVRVHQNGIDVVVRVLGPDGLKIAEVDTPTGASGPEMVFLIAPRSGAYQVQISSQDPKALPGGYQVQIEDVRAATASDRDRVAAQKAFREGQIFHSQQTAESLKQALGQYLEALRLWRLDGNHMQEAATLNSIAQVQQTMGNYRQAVELYQQVLHLRKQLKDRRGEGAALNNLGVIHRALGEPQLALEFFQQALPLAREIESQLMEASLLANISLVYNLLGKINAAIDASKQALLLFRTLGDRLGEAKVLNSLGQFSKITGDFQQSLVFYNQALAVFQVIGNRREEATTLGNIGAVYQALRDTSKALEYFQKALALHQSTGFRQGETLLLNNLGALYIERGENARAVEALERALEQARAMGDQYLALNALLNLGWAFERSGDNQKALDFYLNQVLPGTRTQRITPLEAATLAKLSAVYFKLGNTAQALECLHQALSLQQELGNRQAEAHVLEQLVDIKYTEGALTDALQYLERSLKVRESLQSVLEYQELRSAHFLSIQHFHEFHTKLLMELHRQYPTAGYDRAAFQANEQTQGRLFVQLLRESRITIRQGVAPELLEAEESLQHLLNQKTEALVQLAARKHTPEQAADLRKKRDQLETELQQLQIRIRKENPHYADLKYPKSYTLSEIQEKVLDPNTMLLEFALGEKESYLWTVTSAGFTSHILPGRAAIEQAGLKVYQLLTTREQRAFETESEIAARVKQAEVEFPAAATELSEMLLGPVADQVKGKRLLIVGDGLLQYLPFAALPEPQGSRGKVQGSGKETGKSEAGLTSQTSKASRTNSVLGAQSSTRTPLVVAHEIVMLPSASTLLVKREEPVERVTPTQTIALFANPVFSTTDVRVRLSRTGAAQVPPPGNPGVTDPGLALTANLESVPETESMAKEILALIPSGTGKLAAGFDANLKAATAPELSQYRFLHFATHGFLYPDPELSGVVLSLVDREGNPQPGFLTASNVYNLKLTADLVVLSACQTGLALDFKETSEPGKLKETLRKIKGQGLTGLARGFLYAGAERLAVSLWNIRVKGTRELMNRFYTGMLGPQKLSPAAALRAAQVAMWKESKWNAPYYWAGFVLIGEYR